MHLKRMNYAYEKLLPLSPFTEKSILEFNDEEIALTDQIIYRFSKLQDAIGQKLFKGVLFFLDEEVSNKSAIDIFNRMEKLEIIEDYEKWKNLRDLRNELAHEYEDNAKETAEELNQLFEVKNHIEKYFSDILAFLKRKGFEGGSIG